jgi:uncharacterized membrane protein YphA (DoxX/SURF4 family)
MSIIALYALQAGLGLMILIAGTTKILDADVMAQAFDLLGLGWPAQVLVGGIEVTAGLFLLLPRAGVVGAAMLAGLLCLAAGGVIGQTATSGQGFSAATLTVSQSSQPSLCMGQCRPASATLGARRSWDI